ncbi:MAG: hypothetical protein JNM09_19190 [Blastocatellia bacterium]|nr:hypothetical protein [Blastocatellia bacterium]
MNVISHCRHRLPIFSLCFVAFMLWCLPTQAQTTEQTAEEAARERQRSETWMRNTNLKVPPRTKQNDAEQPVLVQSEDQLSSKQKKRLEPAAEDHQAYAAFLRQPETGIFKLLSATTSKIVHAKNAVDISLPLLGGGAYYSFTKRKHDLTDWAEIRRREGEIEAGFSNLTMGFVTLLGDVPLDALTLNSPGVRHVADFVPATEYDAANAQYQQSAYGLRLDGFIFKSAQPMLVNYSYVLRSIRFGAADQLIVLRVIRQDADGVATIIWKRLKITKAPALRGIPKSNFIASRH